MSLRNACSLFSATYANFPIPNPPTISRLANKSHRNHCLRSKHNKKANDRKSIALTVVVSTKFVFKVFKKEKSHSIKFKPIKNFYEALRYFLSSEIITNF